MKSSALVLVACAAIAVVGCRSWDETHRTERNEIYAPAGAEARVEKGQGAADLTGRGRQEVTGGGGTNAPGGIVYPATTNAPYGTYEYYHEYRNRY